jgi:uncharacterized membrane protein YGL010W
MKNIVELMGCYERYHTKQATKLTHFVGVPAIYFAIFIVLCWIPVPVLGISFTWLLVIALMGYYLFLDIQLGLLSTVLFVATACIADIIAGSRFNLPAFYTALFFFIFGWVAQFIGHYIEGKRPAFLDNVFQVFVAPIFLVGEMVFMLGYRKGLEHEVLRNAGEIK